MTDAQTQWHRDDGLFEWLAEPEPVVEVRAHLAPAAPIDDLEFDAWLGRELVQSTQGLGDELIDRMVSERTRTRGEAA